MAVSVSMAVDNPTPAHGDLITVTYVVAGNDAVPAEEEEISGRGVVGGIQYVTTTLLTVPATPALPETFDVPVCAGLTFTATGDPAVFTATVP
jgi:hypothetical protein